MTKRSCQICSETEDLHWHHIIPRSKGGTDEGSNLILICVSCHRLAHGAEFGGEDGLIKAGLVAAKKEYDFADIIFINHNDEILQFLDDFYDKFGTNVLSEMMTYKALSARDFLRMVLGKKNRADFGLLTGMCKQLSDEKKYDFIRQEQ